MTTDVKIYYDDGSLDEAGLFAKDLPSLDAELIGTISFPSEPDSKEFKSEVFRVLVDGLYEKGLPASALRFFTSELEGHKNLLFVAVGSDPYSYVAQVVLPKGYRFLFNDND